MGRSARRWLVAAVGAVTLGGIAGPVMMPVNARAACPAGTVADTETAGYQCEAECPSGMLLDAQTGSCVAPPGVPPPPLPRQE